MSERKVLTKYYPPDFDPRQIQRVRGPKKAGPKVQTVRLMAPFSMKCTSCGEYIYRGRKFNARKETPENEKYLGIQIYRFYIRCTRCSSQISFVTDPKNQDYRCESGAKRNTEPWRAAEAEETDEQRLDRLEREEAEEAERNAMEQLEAKTVDAKREMAVADALDEIRTRNARLERADRDGAEVGVAAPVDDEAARQDREDAEAARRAFAFARQVDSLTEELPTDSKDPDVMAASPSGSTLSRESSSKSPVSLAGGTADHAGPALSTGGEDMPPPPSFKRVVKKKKDHSALLGIKKKSPLV